jgi:hypothetical protein
LANSPAAVIRKVCPKCASERVRRSRRRGLPEKFIGLLGARANRCRECNYRFLSLGNSTILTSDLQVLFRKAAMGAMAVLALALVLAVVMWFAGRHAAFPAGDGALWIAILP